MKIAVMMASGDEDVWDDIASVQMDMAAGGALVVSSGTEEQPVLEAIYAPGMWMKVEYNPVEDDAQ